MTQTSVKGLINESLLSFGVPGLNAMLCLLIINHAFWVTDMSVAILPQERKTVTGVLAL